MPFKVVVIDDHPLIHEAIAVQFRRNAGEFELVGQGSAGDEIEQLVEQCQPDLILLDIGLPNKSGTTIRQTGRYQVLPAVKHLRAKFPTTHIIILSADADRQLVHAAIEAGAQGYLVKDDELSLHLPDAIRAVMNGGVYFSTEVVRLLSSGRPSSGTVSLTDQQLKILREIKDDANMTSAEHARRLGISVNTYNNHLRAIFGKLGASNLAFALLRVLELGILPLDNSTRSALNNTGTTKANEKGGDS